LLGRSSAASSTSPNTSTSASTASGSRTPPKSVIKTKLEMVATWERSHYQVCHSFDIQRKPKLSHSLPFLSRHPSYTYRSLSVRPSGSFSPTDPKLYRPHKCTANPPNQGPATPN
jgi:hypothetical protein